MSLESLKQKLFYSEPTLLSTEQECMINISKFFEKNSEYFENIEHNCNFLYPTYGPVNRINAILYNNELEHYFTFDYNFVSSVFEHMKNKQHSLYGIYSTFKTKPKFYKIFLHYNCIHSTTYNNGHMLHDCRCNNLIPFFVLLRLFMTKFMTSNLPITDKYKTINNFILNICNSFDIVFEKLYVYNFFVNSYDFYNNFNDKLDVLNNYTYSSKNIKKRDLNVLIILYERLNIKLPVEMIEYIFKILYSIRLGYYINNTPNN